MNGRLIVDPPMAPDWNMAADQALLDSVSADGHPVLRLYRWDRPTLSLGYFQSAAHRNAHQESRAAAMVRRSTGGGAILHDRELTYSLTVPIADRARREVQQIYRAVHDAVRSLLAELGVRLQRFGDAASHAGHDAKEADAPFLCFQRRTDEDLTIAGYKVVGSAQRRSATAVLQHGSILLQASPAAPQLPGINDLAAAEVTVDHLIGELPDRLRLQGVLSVGEGIDWDRSEWQTVERDAAAEIAAQRFSQDAWNLRRP